MAAGLSYQEQSVYFEAQRQGYHLLDVPTVRTSLQVSEVRSRQILSSLARKGVVRRVARGKYAVVSPGAVRSRKAPVDPYLILDELLEMLDLEDGYYVAFASALKLHHISEQIPQAILVAVTRRVARRRLGVVLVRFPLITGDSFFGRESLQYRDARLWVSDLEKTLLDCLDRPALAGGLDEVARSLKMAWPKLDQDRLLKYVRRLGNDSLAQRLGHLLDGLPLPGVSADLRQGLLALRGGDIVPLDPRGEDVGEVDHLWRVRLNTSGAEVLR